MNTHFGFPKYLRRTFLWVLLVVFFSGCVSWRSYCFRTVTSASTHEINDRPQVRKAYALLRDAEEFTSSHVDVAGAPSCLVVAFQVVLESRSAKVAFRSLVAEATLEGQLYALSGLYLVDHEEFSAQLPRYLAMTTPVNIHFGCLEDQTPTHLVVAASDPLDPSHLEAWHQANPLAEYPPVDIATGGWPLEFKNAFKF